MTTDLRRVEIHIGTLCNNRCVFCMSSGDRDHREPWADYERVREELRHFRAQGCRAAGFLGGEPTVYPRILDAVAYARGIGYEQISLCTNGTRLSDAAFCSALVEAGLTRVTLSVHSHRAEVEDDLITLIPGNFRRKIAAIRNLVGWRRKGRLPGGVALNPVLCRPTLKEMEDYILFYGDLGLDDIRFNFIWPHGSVRDDREWIPSLREAVPEMVRVMLLNERRLRRHLTFGGVPRCALSLTSLSERMREYLVGKYLDEAGFDPDNDVSLISEKKAGPDRFVWQQVKRDSLKTKGPACGTCAHDARCEGVWGTYAQLYGFDELRPS